MWKLIRNEERYVEGGEVRTRALTVLSVWWGTIDETNVVRELMNKKDEILTMGDEGNS